jgi:hypothetical protein
MPQQNRVMSNDVNIAVKHKIHFDDKLVFFSIKSSEYKF